MSQNQNNYSNYPYNENNEFNYSTIAQNYNSKHRSIQTFVTHGIMRNNSVLFLNDIAFMDLLYNYSDKCKKIYNDYESILNKNNNTRREIQVGNIIRSESVELNNLMDIMEPTILSKIKNDNSVLKHLVSRGSYGFVYNNGTNSSMKIKIQQINPYNRIFQVYLEFLIMNILYNHSTPKYKNAIPKPYYLYKNEDMLRIYIRNIPNSYTLGDYIDKIIYNKETMKYKLTIERMALKYTNLFKILIKICNLLNYFQNTFNFIHNDFHQGNILVIKDIMNPNPYIIDFGFASIETNIHDKMYYLTNKITQIPYSRMSDTENIYNICKSIDIMHLIIRLIINSNYKNDILFIEILVNKFFKYNHTLYSTNNLLADILQKPSFNISDIYIFTRDYYKLFNHISSLPKYKKIFKAMPSRKTEFKDHVLLTVLENFRPNNAARIFKEIIEELKVHI